MGVNLGQDPLPRIVGMATEALTQTAFIRRRGIYQREQFTSPPLHNIEGIELPIGSVAHYLPEEDKDYAPDESWWLIRGQPKNVNVWIEHLTEFSAVHGKVRPVAGDPQNWVRKWHQKHPNLKRVVNRKTALATEVSLLVVNHALGRHWVTYQNNRFLSYQIAKNTRDNAIPEIGKMVAEVDRMHFIPIRMPNKLYELSKIGTAMREGDDLQIESIKRFGTVEGLFFLDIWKFIEDPSKSRLGTLIDRAYWKRVNLLLTCNGSWFMLNLADLASWVQSPENPDGKWAVDRAQKIFLNDLIQLVEFGQTNAKKPDADSESPAPTPADGSTSSSEIYQQMQQPEAKIPLEAPKDSEPQEESRAGQSGISLLTKSRESRQQKAEDRSKRYSLDSREKTAPAIDPAKQVVAPTIKQMTDEEIDENLAALEQVDALIEETDFAPSTPHVDPLQEGIMKRARMLTRDGVISAAALKQAERLAVGYQNIPNPFGEGKLVDYIKVTEEELKIEAKKIPSRSKRIFDDSMRVSTIDDLTTKYAKHTYKKDALAVGLCIQRSGIAVTAIEADTVETISGSQIILLFRTNAINGRQSTLPVILPMFDEDGTYTSGGTQYRLKTQRVDCPIRKIRPTLVYLTSNYGKTAVQRSDKSVFDYGEWLRNTIAALEIDGHPLIAGSDHGNVFDQSVVAPMAYTSLARRFKTLKLGDFTLLMDRAEIERTFTAAERSKVEHDGVTIVGIDDNNKPVTMNNRGSITAMGSEKGTVEEILGIDTSAAPHPMITVSVRGKPLPLGVVLASYMGLSRLIAHLGNHTRRVLAGGRQDLQWYESPIRFADETLIVDTRDLRTTLLLMGFKEYKKQLRQLSIYGFDKLHSYHFLFDSTSRTSANTVELELLDEQFVDPMTERVLKEMKEPTNWQGLLWRSLELLTTDFSPNEMDGNLMNFKLHERVNGMMYKEMMKSIRRFKQDTRLGKASLDMKPTAVWQKITTDAAISPINNCNPIGDLRAREGVTYIGHGGRSKLSMVARNRKFDKNDMGNISMDTVDSSDTGINVYYSANPNVKTTGGRSEKGSVETTGISSMVSTSMMLGPCLDIDDPRRGVFASIQVGSGVAAKGYRPMPLATGYDEQMAGRVGKKFAYVATGPGKVLAIKHDVLQIEYDSGEKVNIEVGRVFTGGEGHIYPNNIKVTVAAGEKFEEGDGLAFNESWFEQDFHDPKLLVIKTGVPTWVMLSENINTLEDGSVVSPKLGDDLTTYETDLRELVFPFNYSIHNLVALGAQVEPDDILCTIEGASTAAAGLLSEHTVETLNLIADNSPRANYHGTVSHIEIRYNGDIEDMSESLAKLVEDSDKRIRLKNKALGKNIDGGRTDESQRVGGQPLQVDTLVIRIFIDHASASGAGDKGVLGNQLKTVHGQVAIEPMITESGREIGMNYSDNGVESRVVRSPRKWGIYNALLVTAGQRFVKAYRGK